MENTSNVGKEELMIRTSGLSTHGQALSLYSDCTEDRLAICCSYHLSLLLQEERYGQCGKCNSHSSYQIYSDTSSIYASDALAGLGFDQGCKSLQRFSFGHAVYANEHGLASFREESYTIASYFQAAALYYPLDTALCVSVVYLYQPHDSICCFSLLSALYESDNDVFFARLFLLYRLPSVLFCDCLSFPYFLLYAVLQMQEHIFYSVTECRLCGSCLCKSALWWQGINLNTWNRSSKGGCCHQQTVVRYSKFISLLDGLTPLDAFCIDGFNIDTALQGQQNLCAYYSINQPVTQVAGFLACRKTCRKAQIHYELHKNRF